MTICHRSSMANKWNGLNLNSKITYCTAIWKYRTQKTIQHNHSPSNGYGDLITCATRITLIRHFMKFIAQSLLFDTLFLSLTIVVHSLSPSIWLIISFRIYFCYFIKFKVIRHWAALRTSIRCMVEWEQMFKW